MTLLEQPWFHYIKRPSRYLGNEINAVKKEPELTELSIALAFPDVYEVGMSHLGLKILYNLLNARPWIRAERVFAPWVDLEAELRSHQLSLTTLESGHPLSRFDIVGFSLQNELCFTNVVNMLDLSNIPLLSARRTASDPLIIAGGPACFNPEPVAEIFDLFIIGDGEEAILKVAQVLREAKKGDRRVERAEVLSRLHEIQGVYVPSLFSVRYNEDGTIHNIKPLLNGSRSVKKALIPDIDKYPFPQRQVVPFTELIHDRIAIEISRGCTRGCRFCQAGMIYRPVRERTQESIIEKAKKGLRYTGYDELSLLSLSSGDYTCIKGLVRTLTDAYSSEKVALSLPSLRADSLSPSWLEQIKKVRKTGFTLAPEAGNERLRRVINKGLGQKDILQIAAEIYSAGWNLIKLYFMIGLPEESEDDVLDIVHLAENVVSLAGKRGAKNKLNITVSTFVPKAHTPFMWAKQIRPGESKRRINIIRKGLEGKHVRVKWNQPELSWLEGIFARGDRRLCKVLLEAWKSGARFDAWGDQFQLQAWKEAFQSTGMDPSFYLHRERPLHEIFPWDHIDSGVSKSFLKREWRKARAEEPTPDCRHKCLECGVCNHDTVDPRLAASELPPSPRPVHEGTEEGKEAGQIWKYRLVFSKLGDLRFLSHLELNRVFARAFRRVALPLAYSKGYHPLPKMSFFCALPVGMESMDETIDIDTLERIKTKEVKEKLNKELPPGIEILDVEELATGQKDQLAESHFLIDLKGTKFREEDLAYFLSSKNFPLVKHTQKGVYEIDARKLVSFINISQDNMIKLGLKHGSGSELRPQQILKGIFSLKDSDLANMRIMKTKQVLK